MKCEKCEKREATVHLTEIKEGAKKEMHPCEQCASEKGLPGKTHFSISDLLAGITTASQKKQTQKEQKEVRCSSCDLTLSQFQSSGRFGCADCYESFKDDILPLVQKIHDSRQHVGKMPKRVTRKVSMLTEVRRLQLDLRKVVKSEEYEKAVAIRDQIKTLEETLAAGRARASEDSKKKSTKPARKKNAGKDRPQPGKA